MTLTKVTRFSASNRRKGAQPSALDVLIPQYALWRGEDGDLPSILVQAEAQIHDPQGDPIFGLRTFDGNALVADGSEVVLLGAEFAGLGIGASAAPPLAPIGDANGFVVSRLSPEDERRSGFVAGLQALQRLLLRRATPTILHWQRPTNIRHSNVAC